MRINPAIAQHNLAALQQHHPRTARGLLTHLQQQRENRCPPVVHLQAGPGNLPTLLQTDSTPPHNLHQRTTPHAIQHALQQAPEASVYILCGLGAGFALLPLQALDRRCLIIEPRWDILFEALRWFDARPALQSGRMQFCCGETAWDDARLLLHTYPNVRKQSGILHGRDLSPEEQARARSLSEEPEPVAPADWLMVAGPPHRDLLPVWNDEASAASLSMRELFRPPEVGPFLTCEEQCEALLRSNPRQVIALSPNALSPEEWETLGAAGIHRRLWCYDDPHRSGHSPPIPQPVDEVLCFDPHVASRLQSSMPQPVTHLPAATSFAPDRPASPPRGQSGSPCISFVGSTGLQRYPDDTHRDITRNQWLSIAGELIGDASADQAETRYEHAFSLPGLPDTSPLSLRQDLLTFALRKRFLSALADQPLTIYGDSGWKNETWTGSLSRHYHGSSLHFRDETPWVYRHSVVNINLFNVQCVNSPTIRMLDVLCLGGFLLTEHRPFLETNFRIGEELDTFRTPAELADKCRYYLDHPAERARIAAAGQQRVLNAYRYRHRFGFLAG